MPNGNGSGDGFGLGDLLNGLLGVLVDIINAIINFLVALVNALVAALNFLLAGEENIFGFSFQSLSEAWKSFKKLMDSIFKQVVLAALKKLYDLYKKLQAWVKKLKAWLDKFHALQRKYQIAALRRVINLIQRARKILVIFRILHLKFARKLDHWLSSVESRIIGAQYRHARKTNEIIFWIDFLVDPTALFKLSPLAQSIYRYVRGLRGVLGIPESRPLTPDEETRQAQDRALLTSTPHLEDAAVQRILTGLDSAAKVYVP